MFDSSIAAYLINPLKDTYNYDDIARDFLGITLPSHQDIFGKNSHEVIRGQNSQTFDNFLGWNCAVPRMSYKPLKDALAQTQMDRLYEEIELPLAFVLRSMEDYGIKTQRDALKAYGDALISRIRELEKNIMTWQARSLILIPQNSLASSYLKNFGFLTGKRLKPDILLLPKCWKSFAQKILL